ncbi:MAG: hypothetical protein IJV01_01535 [Bacteroidales bacterium]|nr:hypothetical protein [Bacteroidales bacterium]
MVNGPIDLKALNLEELDGVVTLYPWFGGARKELCRRMSELGEGAWSDERYAEAALYIGSRRIVAELARCGRKTDCSDKDIKDLLGRYMDAPAASGQPAPRQERRVIVVGGDYFSQAQYEQVRREGDNVFSSFATRAHEENYGVPAVEDEGSFADFCTETLAQIYIDQGYYAQAKEIYSKLSLRYPEKSAYFAALIEKINSQI